MDFLKLIEDEDVVARPARDILKSTCGFEILNDTLYFSFRTVEDRRGYGTQRIPISDIDEVLEVLEHASANGITSESAPKSCADIVRESLTVNDNGEVRFKSESEKGKKPTLFRDMADFQAFVEEFANLRDAIHAKAKSIANK